jgi:regulatory protein
MSMKNTLTLIEAQQKIERYCAYQERCHIEVEEKLKTMGMIPAVREILISQLIESDYLNESRFAQLYARGKFRIKKWGKIRIQKELKARKISEYNIKLALKEINLDDYLQSFYALFEKRCEAVKNEKPALRKKKIFDYLVYKGWETSLIYEALNDID